jgi:hypothetical protein
VEQVYVSFTYQDNFRVTYGESFTEPEGTLDLPEVAFNFSNGYFQANNALDPQGTVAKLTFSNDSFASIIGVYNEDLDEDYILLLDSISGFVESTDQTSLEQLLSKIMSVQPLTGHLASDMNIDLSDILAGVSVEMIFLRAPRAMIHGTLTPDDAYARQTALMILAARHEILIHLDWAAKCSNDLHDLRVR